MNMVVSFSLLTFFRDFRSYRMHICTSIKHYVFDVIFAISFSIILEENITSIRWSNLRRTFAKKAASSKAAWLPFQIFGCTKKMCSVKISQCFLRIVLKSGKVCSTWIYFKINSIILKGFFHLFLEKVSTYMGG